MVVWAFFGIAFLWVIQLCRQQLLMLQCYQSPRSYIKGKMCLVLWEKEYCFTWGQKALCRDSAYPLSFPGNLAHFLSLLLCISLNGPECCLPSAPFCLVCSRMSPLTTCSLVDILGLESLASLLQLSYGYYILHKFVHYFSIHFSSPNQASSDSSQAHLCQWAHTQTHTHNSKMKFSQIQNYSFACPG